MKYYALWPLLIGMSLTLVEGNKSCTHTDNCQCIKGEDLEYMCPPYDNTVYINTLPNKYLKINCIEVTEFDLTLFPTLDLGQLETFQLKCPLPDNLNATLEKFNISQVKNMVFESIVNDVPRQVITKDLFSRLPKLEILSISHYNLNLEEDFLEYLPDLTNLYLDKNNITELKTNTFSYMPKLKVLHLSRNQLTDIPDGLFKNLTELQELHLWENSLTNLSKNAFVGLGQLASLELSSNKIKYLAPNTFEDLTSLIMISLRSNHLHEIPSDIFKHNIALQGIRIGNNPNLTLSDYVFANLKSLTNLSINDSNLRYLPPHIFEGSTNLVDISLKNNVIVELPPDIFAGLTNLKVLHLERNMIKSLPDNVFTSLTSLEELYLQGNRLEQIGTVFEETTNLIELNLQTNQIATIDIYAFSKLKKLIRLDLSNNLYNLSHIFDANPFTSCDSIKYLDLSHNKIRHFPMNIIVNRLTLVKFNLDYNQISYVDIYTLKTLGSSQLEVSLNNNNISLVNFNMMLYFYNKKEPDTQLTTVYLENNPIICDCSNYHLIEYLNAAYPKIKKMVDIIIGDLACVIPEQILLKNLKPQQLKCPIYGSSCPTGCSCFYMPTSHKDTAVVDCSHKNLTTPPRLGFDKPIIINYPPSFDSSHGFTLDNIEVDLDDNFLEISPYEGLGYDNVTKLFLSNNHIRNVSWVPSKIKVLHLDGNQLKLIDPWVLNSFNKTNLKNLTLLNNPWKCGCSSINLQRFLQTYYRQVSLKDVICEDKQPLVDKKELCTSTLAVGISVTALTFLFIAASIVAIYFYYQEQIKVWLYAKNLCLWFVTEEELDKDKTYDVFVSYSHKDEDFVLQNLLPVLEQGPNPYKVCIHIRDWVPGEFINTQVADSVLSSKRTLVVLSESFLESVWGKMEFRTAHTQAISEGRARVIVVKYGHLNEEKLDNELKSYLKTNTYVEWGDPWFWNKLKYALPHSAQKPFYGSKQKHRDVMLKIDEKFELVSSSPVVQTERIPYALPLNPSLLKDHPLNLTNVGLSTPEAPLITT